MGYIDRRTIGMKKMYVVCDQISAEEIVSIARDYLLSNNFEVQDALDEAGNLCLQGKKSNMLRKVAGMDYAVQLQVQYRTDGSYVLNAGWGRWLSRVLGGTVYTFVAFGFMIIPVIMGTVTQRRLPKKLLEDLQIKILQKYPDSHIYMEAKQ